MSGIGAERVYPDIPTDGVSMPLALSPRLDSSFHLNARRLAARVARYARIASMGCLAAISAPGMAQSGTVDATFGPYGTGWGETITRFATSFVALDGIVLPNDDNLIGGVCTVTTAPPTVGTHFCIQKMVANGGIAGVPTSGGAIYLKDSGTTMNQVSNGAGGAMLRQPDGKILLTAPCLSTAGATTNAFCVARFNADLSIDTTFGGGFADNVARSAYYGLGSSYPNAIALQPDGKIVVAGQCPQGATTTVMCAVRFSSTGVLETAFGNLRQFSPVTASGFDQAKSVIIATDGKIVLGGNCRSGSFQYPCAGRLNTDGSIDTAFNTGSLAPKVLPGIGGADDYINDMKAQANGELVWGGHCTNGAGTQRVPCAIRMLPSGNQLIAGADFDGATVPTGNYQLLEPDSGGAFRIDKLLMPSDGKFFAMLRDDSSPKKSLIRRYNEDGSFDANWTQTPITWQYNSGRAIAIGQQSSGKLLVMGDSEGRAFVLRLNNRPSAGRNCSMDIDGDGKVLPTTDGLLLARASAGLTGTAVTAGAIGGGAQRTTWATIREYLVMQCDMKNLAQ